jgi:isocitrate/isopropylmalate dehydrogenase
MMLEHLGEVAAASAILAAITAVLRAGEVRTPDLGGDARTNEFTDAVLAALGHANGVSAGTLPTMLARR